MLDNFGCSPMSVDRKCPLLHTSLQLPSVARQCRLLDNFCCFTIHCNCTLAHARGRPPHFGLSSQAPADRMRGQATLAHARGRPPHCIRGQATLAHARGRPPHCIRGMLRCSLATQIALTLSLHRAREGAGYRMQLLPCPHRMSLSSCFLLLV